MFPLIRVIMHLFVEIGHAFRGRKSHDTTWQ
jgi:hypothetical protein